jgi:hypothetical protein
MPLVAREFERAHTERGPRGGAWYRDLPFPPPAERIRKVTVALAHFAHKATEGQLGARA